MDTEHQVPIWFFVGGILLIYGVLIFGGGAYAWINPPPLDQQVRLFEYHADFWWSLVLIAVGAFYCYRFWPSRQQLNED